MVTMAEIAKRAQVSAKTVSRVVNGDVHVSQKTHERVSEIIGELDYHPHAAAQTLMSRKARTIGVAIYQIRYIMEDYFAALIAGMEEVLGFHNYNLLFATTHRTEGNSGSLFFLRKVKEQRLDGLVIADKVARVEDVQALKNIGTPFVMVDNYFPGLDVNCVLADYQQGMFDLTEHLIQSGHSRIAFLGSTLAWHTSRAQLEGYKSALEKNNLDYNQELVREVVGSTPEEINRIIARQVSEMLDTQPVPTAIAVYDDVQVPQVFGVLREKGLTVPEDIAVVGFYDFRIATQWYPGLTTVRVPLEEMGARAAQKLIRLIDGEDVEEHEIKLQTELVIRDSCGSGNREHR